MKIRTDFVTNSSSSSYCVSLGLQLKDKRNVWLRFYPKGEDGLAGSVTEKYASDNKLHFEAEEIFKESAESLRFLIMLM